MVSFHSTMTRMANNNRSTIPKVGKNAEHLECSCVAGGSLNFGNYFRNVLIVPTEAKHMQAP